MDQKVYFIIMAAIAGVGLVAKGIHALIRSGFDIHKFFIQLDGKVDNIDSRLTKVEEYIEGTNSSGDAGGSGYYRKDFRSHTPVNGVGLREEFSGDTFGLGDRPSALAREHSGHSESMVYLGLGEHVKRSGSD